MGNQVTHKLNFSEALSQEPTLILKFISPVCNLISLYDGPNLTNQEFWRDEQNNYVAEELKNKFSFNFRTNSSHSKFSYAHNEVELITITMDANGAGSVTASQSISPVILTELQKIVEAEKQLHQTEQVNLKSTEKPEPIQFKIPFSNNSDMETKLIHRLNQICKLISKNNCPVFGPEDIKIEERRAIGEVYSYFDISNDLYSASFESSVFETGYWNGSKGGHTQFLLKLNNQTQLRVTVSGLFAYFEIDAGLEDFISEIKNNPASYI